MTTEFADVPPGETSVAARSLEKRLYSQASSVKKKKWKGGPAERTEAFKQESN